MIERKESKLVQVSNNEHNGVIPATGVILFVEGDSFWAFRNAKGTTLGEGIWGIPGGRHEVDLSTGQMETSRQAGPREVQEETGIIVKSEHLIEVEGNVFRKDMSKNGSPEVIEWAVFYSHNHSGEARHVQPEEGKPHKIGIEEFFALEDDVVAPNAKRALLNALIHTANDSKK